MIAHGEVFLRALGEDAQRLHPEMLARLQTPSSHRRAVGVFTVAGSRFRWLTALALPVVGADAVVTRLGRDVPFSVVTTAGRDASGRATLDTVREFGFPDGVQRIRDRLTVSVHPGLVRNVLGAAGRVELIEECSVTDRGFLRMRTRRVALRLGGRRFALPGVLRVDVDVEDGWDAEARWHTIALRARNPLLGTVLEYRGRYRLVDPEQAAGRPQ